MDIKYRVVLTGHDMVMHEPCVGSVLHQMHDTHIRAVHAAQEAAAQEIVDLASRKGMILPGTISMSFEETLHLPVKVQSSEAKAVYEHGVLQITIPRELKKNSKLRTVKVSCAK